MCHKLISVYACNHSKIICTTPCPYAFDTGGRIPRRKCNDQDLSCSDSTVSSLAPSIRLEEHPAQLRSPPASRPGLPLPTPQQISQQSTKIASAPAFRFIPRAPSPSHVGSPSPGYTPHSPESEHSLQTSPSAALLPDEQFDIDPNFCDYHFPHNLPTSKLPSSDGEAGGFGESCWDQGLERRAREESWARNVIGAGKDEDKSGGSV
ncbi:hypothetical protein SNOG_14062 [Parastagonospora nodorum SN15]|uniref:Uncharacterized protein n=1 Tax=Phaeosphaeria nodorum (strain SN15 / ATCC MYA-4574 / FGSC 10173) TaxID=321614 RepID=Q0U2H1_PHANO|nr:hypothetical protein SNOG_14062 [Parastagonospora nodorum SN15]EAT78687.1 hypothetical protein SNOG_14062 [Parastagonospora nodorum SN15]